MGNLFKAYLFKLRKDLAFRITLIIGGGLAILMTLLFLLIEKITGEAMLNGQMMLIMSLSPVQNFGIAIPVNLITFTVLEFSQGTIRNKIIAGYSKGQIYISIFLTGLVFTLTLASVYALLCFGLGSVFGGFDPHGAIAGASTLAPYYIPKIIAVAVLCYVSITSFTIFFATLFRSIGPTIPVVIVGLMFAYLVGTLLGSLFNNETIVWILRIADPLYAMSVSELGGALADETFVSALICNAVYTLLFFGLGLLIFRKRDIK